MPCSASKRSLASLQRSGSPTKTGTICVGLVITGNAAAVSTALVRAARPVHANGVHLVDISHRAIMRGEIANLRYRRHVAIHGIEAFEDDEFGAERIGKRQQLLQMRHVVVPEDLLLAMRLADAFDHR